jgi:hypothetical protein
MRKSHFLVSAMMLNRLVRFYVSRHGRDLIEVRGARTYARTRMDAASDRNLFLFSVVVVFLALGFFFEKQFVDHPALLKIGRDLAQCPIVFNVLLYDKTVQERLGKWPQPPADRCAISIPLRVLCVTNSKWRRHQTGNRLPQHRQMPTWN